jgi:hypothetical protein
LRISKIDFFELRPRSLGDHGTAAECGDGTPYVIGDSAVETRSLRVDLGAWSSRWPRGMLSDERGQQRMDLLSIAVIKFSEEVERVHTTVTNRDVVAGQLVDRFGEQFDRMALAIHSYLAQRHGRPSRHPGEREQAAEGLKQR